MPAANIPRVVDEAIATIGATAPDAVTINEACSGAIERIAEETGYDYAFGTVIYIGGELACKNPNGRGAFGIAVLTASEIGSLRRGVCRPAGFGGAPPALRGDSGRAHVCTTHLAVGSQVETNEAQCPEFTAILDASPAARRRSRAATSTGQTSCAPDGAS
ncbi:hypothetical protein [Ornithinimicrobium cryptoxanthini]|uniref:hypothetical protein n=1 Tax=Ornithinimicrobium cryptoxanthini TaxID=2934161 RepID=UPI00211768C3|nr:hypothetical protein [Ornithinimicrobium cryptoxanthini]